MLGKQFLNIAIAQGETKVQPDRVLSTPSFLAFAARLDPTRPPWLADKLEDI